MSNLDKVKGISYDENSPIPMYCDGATKDKHDRNIKDLFELNFGKDWVFFLNLFYWDRFGKHHIVYKNPHRLEDNKKFFTTRRKGYYKMAKQLMEHYFQFGFNSAKEAIEQDKFRLLWSETPYDKSTLTIWVSSRIYDQVQSEE